MGQSLSTAALAPNKSYWIWLLLTLEQGTSTTYIYSTWYKPTVAAGTGTSPGTAAATVTLTPGVNNGAGQVLATATINIPSVFDPVNNPNGWSNNTQPQLGAVPQGATVGPGQGPPGQFAIPNPVVGNPNSWTAGFSFSGVTTGTYRLLCIHPIRQGQNGVTQLVGSPLVGGYTVP
jgi:hypothetical protein